MTDDASARDGILQRVLTWLREGYPEGIPEQDYVTLFGILHRDLTLAEVDRLARELAEGAGGLRESVTREQIAEAIQRTVLEDASDTDVSRVASRLAAGGWPLARVGFDD